jgi:hypothetical protein
MLCALRDIDYATIELFLNGLSKECLKELMNFEIALYKTKKLNIAAKLFIYFTKIYWRTRGFPIVGKAN